MEAMDFPRLTFISNAPLSAIAIFKCSYLGRKGIFLSVADSEFVILMTLFVLYCYRECSKNRSLKKVKIRFLLSTRGC